MAKKIIRTGTAADPTGDSLKNAFIKVNDNFTELYNALGLDAEGVNLGAFEFGGSVDGVATITTTDSSAIVIDQATTVTSNLTVGGDLLPSTANGGDLGSLARPWRSLHVSNNTIFFGGVPLSLEAGTNTLKVNNIPVGRTINFRDIPDAPAVPVDISDLTDDDGLLEGGGAGPVQPYLELTDTPFITQPAVLGTATTITSASWSNNARFTVVIGEGPSIDSITVTNTGTGYVVDQRYRIEYWQIGGSNNAGSIDFEVATVNTAGSLLTIANVAFVGTATNTPGTYTDTSPLYLPSVFDEIDTGLTLTRGRQAGIFNIEAETEYDDNNYLSPLGTEWNSDGWGNLTGLSSRTYTTWRSALNNAVGENIIASELVMHDTINDKYYKFDFTNWGGNNSGSFAYTRTLVEDPNYFRKTNGGEEVDEISEGLHIARSNNGGWLYNPLEDDGHDGNTPTGSVWNNDGWMDLTDIETRTYVPLETIWGGNFANIVGSRMIMKDTTTDKYWAIEMLSWTQGQNGGGFSYTRKEIDLTKLDQGVKFADGTVQTTAYIPTNVVSAAPNERRIETVSGYKEVSVTEVTTSNTYNIVSIARPDGAYDWDLYIDRATNPELEAAVDLYGQDGGDDHSWRVTINGQVYTNDQLQVYLNNDYIIIYSGDNVTLPGDADVSVTIERITGGDSVIWWNKSELPGGASDFRGAVIDYHAFTDEATWIGTIHIVDDDGENHITHTEVSSGNDDSMNDNLWIVESEGRIRYARFDFEAKTLKIHWTAKVFYGSETND